MGCFHSTLALSRGLQARFLSSRTSSWCSIKALHRAIPCRRPISRDLPARALLGAISFPHLPGATCPPWTPCLQELLCTAQQRYLGADSCRWVTNLPQLMLHFSAGHFYILKYRNGPQRPVYPCTSLCGSPPLEGCKAK